MQLTSLKSHQANQTKQLANRILWVALIALLTIVLGRNAFAQTAFVGQIHKTVASAGTPERVSATDLLVRKAWFVYSFSNTGTTGYVGNSAANAVAAKGLVLVKPTATVPSQPVEIGDLGHNAGPRFNLKEIWVDSSSNGDEVNVFYIE